MNAKDPEWRGRQHRRRSLLIDGKEIPLTPDEVTACRVALQGRRDDLRAEADRIGDTELDAERRRLRLMAEARALGGLIAALLSGVEPGGTADASRYRRESRQLLAPPSARPIEVSGADVEAWIEGRGRPGE